MSGIDRIAQDAFATGRRAFNGGTPWVGKPYSMSQSPRCRTAWGQGWEQAKRESEERNLLSPVDALQALLEERVEYHQRSIDWGIQFDRLREILDMEIP